MWSRRQVTGAIVVAMVGAACSDSTGPTPSVALTLETPAVTLIQGATEVVNVTVARENFDKPVTLAVEGTLPAGVTATLTQTSLAASQTTTFLTVTAAGNATPANITLAIVATGEGLTSQTQPLNVTVTLRGNYTLGTTGPAAVMATDGAGAATVTLARTGGNTSDVALVASGVPAGVTAAFAQSPVAGSGVMLRFTANGAPAPGTYPVTVTGSAAGFSSNQTTTVQLQVIAVPTKTSTAIPICANTPPVWFAYQNEGYDWQRATPAGATVSFDATDEVAIAFAFSGGNQSELVVYYLTRSELAAFNDTHCAGTRAYSGNVVALSTGQSALVRLGRASDLVTATAPGYVLENLPARPLDQVAVRGVVSQSGPVATLTPDKVVIRRGIDAPSGTVLPEIDFDATEENTLVTSTLTLNGTLGGETVFVSNLLRPATRTTGLMQVSIASGSAVTLHSVPADKLDVGDVQEQNVYAENSTGLIGHTAVAFTRAPADRTLTLGALLQAPAVETVSSAPYARFRATLPSQADYPSLAVFTFLQTSLTSARFVTQYVTAAFLGGTPSSWEIILPDFSAVPGFQSSWMPAAGQATAYLAEAFSGRAELILGAPPLDGDIYREGFHQSSATALRSLRAPDGTRLHRANGIQPQYLSR